MRKLVRIFMIVIVGILLAVFIAAAGMILFLPKSRFDLMERNLNKKSYYDDVVEVSLTTLEVQREDGMLYYIDRNGNLLCGDKKNNNEKSREVLVEDVNMFLKRGNIIYFLKDDGIYSLENERGVQKVLNEEDVLGFAMGENINIVYTGKRIITYDKNWNQTSTCSFKEICGHAVYGDVLYSEGNLVISDEEGGAVFVYSIENNRISQIDVPMDLKNNNDTEELIMDIVKKEKDIYCMLAMYESADLYSFRNRIQNSSNGVYRLNLTDMKFEKISSVAGFDLMCLENKLYVIDSGYLICFKRAV